MDYVWMIEVNVNGEYWPLHTAGSRHAARLMHKEYKKKGFISNPSRIRRYNQDKGS